VRWQGVIERKLCVVDGGDKTTTKLWYYLVQSRSDQPFLIWFLLPMPLLKWFATVAQKTVPMFGHFKLFSL
jgi:hypothetical protein